jgi:hypothetical protein
MILLHFEYTDITELLLEVALGTKTQTLHVESYFMCVLGVSRLALLLQFYFWTVWYCFDIHFIYIMIFRR